MSENENPLWFYELHAIPCWHHEAEKSGSLVVKPNWCVTDHADCLAYVFGWCLGDNPGQGIVPNDKVSLYQTKLFAL